MYQELSIDQANAYINNNLGLGVWDYMHLAGTPHEEPCAQVGKDLEDSKIESQVLIEQLIREVGQPPEGTKFFICRNLHDYGIYYEAAIFYDATKRDEVVSDYSAATEYAMECENSIPEKWDEPALASLRAYGHSKHQPGKVVQMKKAS